MFAGISAEGLEKGIFIGSSFRLRLRNRALSTTPTIRVFNSDARLTMLK